MFFLCIYLPHLKGRSQKIMSDISPPPWTCSICVNTWLPGCTSPGPPPWPRLPGPAMRGRHSLWPEVRLLGVTQGARTLLKGMPVQRQKCQSRCLIVGLQGYGKSRFAPDAPDGALHGCPPSPQAVHAVLAQLSPPHQGGPVSICADRALLLSCSDVCTSAQSAVLAHGLPGKALREFFPDHAVFSDIPTTTDLCLHVQRCAIQTTGKVLRTLVLQEHARWLNLANLSNRWNMSIFPEGIFDSALANQVGVMKLKLLRADARRRA